MTLFRLDASINPEVSISRRVADTAQSVWQEAHPGGLVVRRDLGKNPLPTEAWQQAAGAAWTPPEARSAAQADAVALSGRLADELVSAQAYIFAVPLYNFGVAQHVKSWIDLVLTDSRFAPGNEPVLAGRTGVLVVSRGGAYGAGTPRAGWDHSTPYLERIFSDVFGLDLHVSEAELTMAHLNPAMEALRGMADESLAAAFSSAGDHGRLLAERTTASA